MRYAFTPDEAQTIADALIAHLRKGKHKVEIETPICRKAPYRTTLIARRSGLVTVFEAQGSPVLSPSIDAFATWLFAWRLYCEFYLATHEDADMKTGLLADMKQSGIGLAVVDDHGAVSFQVQPRNPALVVTPEPTLRLGRLRGSVDALVDRFNSGVRKDALRDMCELVEQKTAELAGAAARKGWLTTTPNHVEARGWSDQINVLASARQFSSGRRPLLDDKLKSDLHSFRGARNLVDHRVKTRREEAKRQRQFAERMMMGPRLLEELLSLRRKIK